MAFDRPRRSGVHYSVRLIIAALTIPAVYAQYIRQHVRRSRVLAGRTNRGTFAAYLVGYMCCLPVFLLMPSYRRQVHDEMGR